MTIVSLFSLSLLSVAGSEMRSFLVPTRNKGTGRLVSFQCWFSSLNHYRSKMLNTWTFSTLLNELRLKVRSTEKHILHTRICNQKDIGIRIRERTKLIICFLTYKSKHKTNYYLQYPIAPNLQFCFQYSLQPCNYQKLKMNSYSLTKYQ